MSLLLSIPGCLVAPPDEAPYVNQPPSLDWKLTDPQSDWVIFNRLADSSLTFSVSGAVSDPEGDQLYYIWYWRIPGGQANPELWRESMTISPCAENAATTLRTALTVQVTVAISDHFIDFDRVTDPEFPVIYTGYPPQVREWTVELAGQCVD